MSDHYCRATVARLCEADGPVSADELAGVSRRRWTATSSGSPRRSGTAILPLADADAVDYHRERGIVAKTPETEPLARLLAGFTG